MTILNDTRVRRATEEDLRFIRSSWATSYRTGGYAPEVGIDIIGPHHAAVVDDLLKRCHLLVLSHKNVPDEICAWACFGDDVLHYVYTKFDYRKLGLAMELLNTLPFKFHTHETRAGRKLLAKVGKSRYNPFRLYSAQPVAPGGTHER